MSGALRQSSNAQVRECLERALAETRRRRQSIAALDRRPFAYQTSFAIDELDVTFDDGESLSLLVKDVHPAGLSRRAAAAKPAFAIDPGREIAVYRRLLSLSALSAPRFHGAIEDDEHDRAWLFVERVPGLVLADVGEPKAWRSAAAWAARLDDALRPHRDSDLNSRLLHRDRNWHRHWLDAAMTGSRSRELASRLRATGAAYLDRLDDLPRSFVHGELYASNVVVDPHAGEAARIAPVDWELAGTGPFALDLAALISGWEGTERAAMCEAFREELPVEHSREGLLDAAALCELSLALQWIGWSHKWPPPAEHLRDWESEALRLLEEVGL